MSTETTQGQLIDKVIKIRRCAAVVKGGRRFSFTALVVVGDGQGKVGWGYGKANEVPPAVEKAVKDGSRNLVPIHMEGTTIPHTVKGHFGAAQVVLVPAGPGTGVIAGAAVRAVCEACGIRDILTKSFGSTNPTNLVKATIDALQQLRSQERSRAAAGSLAVMNLNDVHRGIQKNKSRKRIGRGPGSGHGKTAGRGSKGQGSRSGYSHRRRSSRAARCPWSAASPNAASTTASPRPWPSSTSAIAGEALPERRGGHRPRRSTRKDLVKGTLRPAEGARQRRADEEPEDLGPPASAARPRRRSRRPAARPSSCPARSPW